MGGTQPTEKEHLSKGELVAKIMAMSDLYKGGMDYENSTLWLAKQFYLLKKDGIKGDMDFLYQEMKKKNGLQTCDFTGFMVGWAYNAAAWLMDEPPAPNPALLTIGCWECFKINEGFYDKHSLPIYLNPIFVLAISVALLVVWFFI